MKGRVFIVFVGLIGLIAFSCKKEISPVVTYTVVDTLGSPLENARLFTHPCFDGVSCDTTRLNENFIKTGLTNSAGQITYTYPYSAIIDVAASWTDCDTAAGIFCLYSGRTVARFETKKAKDGEENNYNVRVVVR